MSKIMLDKNSQLFKKKDFDYFTLEPKKVLTQIITGNKLRYQRASPLIFLHILSRSVWIIIALKRFLLARLESLRWW